MLTTALLEKPLSSDVPRHSTFVASRSRHPSRVKITLSEYLCQIWENLKEKQEPLSFIIAKIDDKSSKKRADLDQLAKIMRSVVHGVDDFVGFGHHNEVIMILPQTDLGEAIAILQQIHSYYDEKLQKLELTTTIPSNNSMIQPLIVKIKGYSHQLN